MLIYLSSFVAGVVTILSPCIWPILPIVISSAYKSGKAKAISLMIGITCSFTLFTLSLSNLIKMFELPPNIFRISGVLIIAASGIIMIVPFLTEKFEALVSRLTSSSRLNVSGEGVLSGFLTGVSLGILWTPCSGPIITTVSVMAASRVITSETILITFFYGLGVGFSLFFISLAEQFFLKKHPISSKASQILQRTFGVVILVWAVLIYSNNDKLIQAKIIQKFPFLLNFQVNYDLSPDQKFQYKLNTLIYQKNNQKKIQESQTIELQPTIIPTIIPSTYRSSLPDLKQAKEINGITRWYNSGSDLKLSDYRGKVVFLDFWSYTCAPCIEGIAYRNEWLKKYSDKGFAVISIHTPGTTEAKSEENVKKAIDQYNVTYPVGVDNNYTSWDIYQNNSLPSEYLIDKNGMIRYQIFTSGHYEETENAINELLREL